MKGVISYKMLSWEEIIELIGDQNYFPPDTTYALFYRIDHIQFVTLKTAKTQNFFKAQWNKGHLFNKDRELRFEKKENFYYAYFLTEKELPDKYIWKVEEFETGKELSFLLFGERKKDDPGWREARIPMWIKYPVPRDWKRLCLIGIPYLKNGIILKIRWKGVKESG